MNRCTACANYIDGMCGHELARSLVDGSLAATCKAMREDGALCGKSGELFEHADPAKVGTVRKKPGWFKTKGE